MCTELVDFPGRPAIQDPEYGLAKECSSNDLYILLLLTSTSTVNGMF